MKAHPIEGTGRIVGARGTTLVLANGERFSGAITPCPANGGFRIRLLAVGVQRTGSGGIFRRGGCIRLAPCPDSLGSAGGVLVSVIACGRSIGGEDEGDK